MSEYLIQESTLANIGDGVRGLLTVGEMTPVDMAEELRVAADVASYQRDLIDQIRTALDGKITAAPSGPKLLTVNAGSNSRNITFSNLENEPSMFVVLASGGISLSSTNRYAIYVFYDGTSTVGVYATSSSALHTTNGFTFTFSNNSLTINTASTTNGGYFRSGIDYTLLYI